MEMLNLLTFQADALMTMKRKTISKFYKLEFLEIVTLYAIMKNNIKHILGVDEMDVSAILMIVIIFSINIVYVTFFTLRMILTLKGYRYIAALYKYGRSGNLYSRTRSSIR